MWESLRVIFIFRCPLGAISKACGKGGKHVLSFSGLSTYRHFLRPLCQPSVLRGQPQPLKEFRFGLLHPPGCVCIADGRGDSFQRVHAQSIAQVLCWFLQQRQGFQRGLVALVTDALAAFLVDVHIGLSAGTMVVQIWMCAVKVGAFQQEFVLPGNWFVPPGNNRSSSRGNEAVGAFGVKGRLSDSVSM